MTENNLATALPTRQAAAVEGRSKRLRVTGKLRVAIEAMIWEGLARKDAAVRSGLADASIRFAMRKPHVLAFYNAELANLRTSLRARNVHRLDSIADNSGNDMARVAAVKTLEQLTDAEQNHRASQTATPGVTIIIERAAEPKVINPQPFSTEPPQIIIPAG